MHICHLILFTKKAWFIFEMSWITGRKVLDEREDAWIVLKNDLKDGKLVHMMLVISGKSLHRGTGVCTGLCRGFAQGRVCTGFAQRWGMRSYLSALTIIRCIHCWSLWCILQWNLQCTVEIFSTLWSGDLSNAWALFALPLPCTSINLNI